MNTTATLSPATGWPELPRGAKALERLLHLKPSFAVHDRACAQRPALEAYVRRQFEENYGASVTEFLPTLFSVRCGGSYSAVAGTRTASSGELFVEQYLDVSVEQAIGRLAGAPASRVRIVEIGNLAATRHGATLLCLVLQIAVLQAAGFEWAVFAATGHVAELIDKLNFVTFGLGRADPARLGEDASRWGRYYDTRPTLRAGDLTATCAVLRRSPLSGAVISCFGETIAELAQSMMDKPAR
ncbi:MAG: thermostable hemolysin [Gammaproteobacteria bacterium]